MGHHRLIAWIRQEITSTEVVMREEVVGYKERLEPNPAMHISEGTNYPTTANGEFEIHQDPIYADVPRTVPDERRASDAAEALVALVLTDERHLYLAEELMGEQKVFIRHWERLSLHGRDRRTKRIALHHLGRGPSQLFMKALRWTLAPLKTPLEFLWQLFVGVCFYGWIICLIWPDSKAGMWIAAAVKRILAEARRIIYD
ncbi:MAG: hypothetical protein PHC90_05860 [Syntrophorhabdaceae bacterium]|nr:hypothetical protein [Syntrophorhabdaceae bacterium]